MKRWIKAIWYTLFGADSRSLCRYCDLRCEAWPCSQTREATEIAFERSELSLRPITQAQSEMRKP